MPIDYKRYPPNWKTEIVPRILERAQNRCENEGCDFKNGEYVWSVKYCGRVTGWFRDYDDTYKYPKSYEIKNGEQVRNPKHVRVVLTVAHLDHDETNHQVSDERLRAFCQLCHLRYDANEKYRLVNNKTK